MRGARGALSSDTDRHEELIRLKTLLLSTQTQQGPCSASEEVLAMQAEDSKCCISCRQDAFYPDVS